MLSRQTKGGEKGGNWSSDRRQPQCGCHALRPLLLAHLQLCRAFLGNFVKKRAELLQLRKEQKPEKKA